MKKSIFKFVIAMCMAAGVVNATTVIGTGGEAGVASSGNGNFEGSTGNAFLQIPHWFNLSGGELGTFGATSGMAGSPEPYSRGCFLHPAFQTANDTGYTVVAAGETFNLSIAGDPYGSGYSGDEKAVMTLFTSTTGVDENTEVGDISVLSTTKFSISGTWTSYSADHVYTTTVGDIGKTIYLGLTLENPTAPDVYPRYDVVKMEVIHGIGWLDFVGDYGLSGDKLADADSDGVFDVYEFAHGGDPTNSADTGILPRVEYREGDVVSFISLETTHSNPGISYWAEWTDNLETGKWQKVWDSESSVASAIPGYDEVERQIDGGADKALFFRNRLFHTANRPNILFILADDLGYADVGFNHPYSGANEIMSPELDNLAADGTIFTSAYVVHPFCGPSRMGLLSGRYPHEFGGPFNLPDTSDYSTQGIPASETLFSTMLQDADYYTGIMGKWHLGIRPQHHPNVKGFDEFYGFLGGGLVYWGPYSSGGWNYTLYPQENGVSDTSLTSSDHITDVLTEKGSNFIAQAASTEDPFFLFMSYNAPHSVLTYNGRDQAKAEDLALFPTLSGNRKIYAALVYQMDRCIGELVQTLKDTGQYDNTLIIFLSDNGGREDTLGSGDNGILRGSKGSVNEGGFRVPMFMHWPGVIPAGITYDHPVTALDFYPTFANVTEATVPVTQEVDGKDIWDAVLAGSSARPGEPIYTVTYSTSAASVGIRQDQWKAVKLGTQNWKLYNIDNDIGENINVSGANQAVLSGLVSEGGTWSGDHVQPLWWNNYAAETTWNNNNMPHYNTVFVLP